MIEFKDIRATSDSGDEFPWESKRVCYLEIRDGVVTQPGRFIADLRAAVRRVIAGESQMIAVWPGEWRSDAFTVDNPEALAAAIKA